MKEGLAAPAIGRLAANIERAWPEFTSDEFRAAAMDGLSELELKARVAHVAGVLHRFLPGEYAQALEVLVNASHGWDRGDKSDPLSGFAAWPVFHFIEVYGADDFDRSMAALHSITSIFTGEFAIRPLIERYPRKAFAELKRWTHDESKHVRRLVSEGCRSRLPWGTRIPALVKDPEPTLALLEELKDDAALYVRRSVANNLNDIAKDHPDRVIDVCLAWLDGASPERLWIIKHATRTLVKDGHPRVWGLLGFTRNPKVEMSALELDPARTLAMGSALTFRFELASTARSAQRLVVDYAIHFVKASGKTRPKVFKLKVVELASGAKIQLSRRQVFRPLSTRKIYPGVHVVEILVNGVAMSRAEFELTGA